MTSTHKSQIKIGAIVAYFGMFVKILAGFIYTPWLVDKIGKSNYGLFSLSISLISMFAIDFGLGVAVARFLSKHKAAEEHEEAEKFLGMAFKLYLILSVVLFIVLFIMYFFLANIYTGLTVLEIERLRVIYIITGLFTAVSFLFKPFEGILIANERFVFLKTIDLANKLITIFLMVLALLLGYGLYALVLVNAFVGMVMIFIQYLYIRKKTETKVKFCYSERSMYHELFYFSFWTTIAIVAHRFILNIAPSILAVTSGSTQVSIFAIAATIEGYTFTIACAIGGLFLPKVTKLVLQGKGKMDKVDDLNVQVGRIQLMIIGMITIIFLTMGKEFMKLWMGPDFKDSYYVACLLITPYIVILTNQIANTTLMAVNKVKYMAISTLLTALFSVLISLLLSRQYGAIGAGIGILIGNVIGRVIFANIIYEKVLKLDMIRFYRECHVKMVIPLLILALCAVFLQYSFPSSSLIIFILKVGIVTCIYCLSLWIISLNKSEKDLITGLLALVIKKIR